MSVLQSVSYTVSTKSMLRQSRTLNEIQINSDESRPHPVVVSSLTAQMVEFLFSRKSNSSNGTSPGAGLPELPPLTSARDAPRSCCVASTIDIVHGRFALSLLVLSLMLEEDCDRMRLLGLSAVGGNRRDGEVSNLRWPWCDGCWPSPMICLFLEVLYLVLVDKIPRQVGVLLLARRLRPLTIHNRVSVCSF